MDEQDVVREAIQAANRAIGDVIEKAEASDSLVDADGNPVQSRVVAIIAATTLAALYAVESGLRKEKFMVGMDATFDHIEASISEAQEILSHFKEGDNKWVQ